MTIAVRGSMTAQLGTATREVGVAAFGGGAFIGTLGGLVELGGASRIAG
jgi:hypothetical protein